MTAEYDAVIAPVALNHALPLAFVKAIITVESAFNPRAVRHEPQLQTFSAGLMQILLTTARSMGYTGTSGQPSDLSGIFDPATNVEYGCRWLSHCVRLAGNLEGGASAYNGGYRPALGFGHPAPKDLQVCLAHDQASGACIRWQAVKAGEYANQGYVDRVKGAMAA